MKLPTNSSKLGLDGGGIEIMKKKPADDGGEESRKERGNHDGDDDGAISRLRRFRNMVGMIVNHNLVQGFILTLIVVNAIMMGVGTFEFVWDNPEMKHTFDLVDRVFLVIFTVESIMQIIYHGLALFQDGWLVFDLTIVILSWSFEEIQIIRAFRIFRALRLITHIETMRNLVVALLSCIPNICAIGGLLIIVFFVYAVLMTQLFKDVQLSEPYFTSLDASFFTLFQMMTLDWAELARECMVYYSWSWVLFVSYVMVTAFLIVSLIIGVICDAVAFGDDDDELETEEDVALQNRVYMLSERMIHIAETQERLRQSFEFLSRQVQITKAKRSGTNSSGRSVVVGKD